MFIIKRTGFLSLLTLFVLLAFCYSVKSQNGSIAGKITDKKTKEPLVGVNVVIQGTSIGSATDLNGDYKINGVKQGTYIIVISYISYKTKIVEKIKVISGNTTIMDEVLEEDIIKINNVIITGRKITNSEISILTKMKSSDLILSGVSGQMIAKTLDRDASEVIKRVPGVTIIDGRFVMVRGLSERYNNVWLNGASTPSSESDVKAFSFDVIPSSMIDNLLIYKTASPELPADFAGASIQIFTKNIPDNNGISISYTGAYRQNSTSKDFYSLKGGKYDWLGFDDGERSLPKSFPSASEFTSLINSTKPQDVERVTQLGRSLNKDWSAEKGQSLPDQKISIGFTKRFNIKKTTLGNITSINYGTSKTAYKINRTDYQSYDTINDKSVLYYDFIDDQYTSTTRLSAIHNWSIVPGKNHKIDFRNLFNQVSNNRTTIRNGKEYYGGNTIKAYEYKYQSRLTYSGQLGGTHNFHQDKTKISWLLGYAYTNRKEPDTKRLTFTKVEEDPSDPHYGLYSLQFFFAATPELVGRLYMDMKENIYMGSANLEQKLKIKEFAPELKIGFYYESKTREFNARNIGYKMANPFFFNSEIPFMSIEEIFSDKNINDSNGIKLDEKTNASDSYHSTNELICGYVGFKVPVFKKINLNIGLRIEQNTQNLSSYKTDDPTQEVFVDIDTLNFFPSINLSYSLNKKNLIRVAWGRTLNRPEFREIAPMLFYDFEAKAGVRGNYSLKNAYINNYDIRYEFYPSMSENITIGCFYKSFSNPIEMHVVPAGTGLEYTFRNAEKAYSLGAELDIRKSFENLKKNKSFLRFFKDFSLVLNGSIIKSQVEFAGNSLEKPRPLQGQSPFIINAGVFYQNDSLKLTVSLMYNIIGKRVILVGDPYSGNPDVYEMPRNSLDLLISKKIGKYIIVKMGVQDLLNQEIIYKQTIHFNKDINGDGIGDGDVSRDETKYSFHPGRYFSLGIGLNF